MASSRARRAVRWAGLLTLAASALALAAGDRLLDGLRAGRPCSYRSATGRPCLGCGGTRALALAARGDLPGALRENALGAFAGAGLWTVGLGAAVTAASGSGRGLLWAAALVAALGPGAFVWNALAWWGRISGSGGP